MEEAILSPREKEQGFYRDILWSYLKHGSVDAVLKEHKYNLPISEQGFHHLLNRWGIVKAAGPNSNISEALAFLEQLAEEKIPLEKLYSKLPPSFETSKKTLHRILKYIKDGISRRAVAALVVTSEYDPTAILVGNDVSAPRLEFGKRYGSLSYPMGFARVKEDPRDSIRRVLQREVFSRLVLNRQFPEEIIPINPIPFMQLYIADITVSIYHLELPTTLVSSLESPVLQDLRFVPLAGLIEKTPDNNFRSGVIEIAKGYAQCLDRGLYEEYEPLFAVAELNLAFNHHFVSLK